MTTTKTKPKKAKQGELPGVERQVHKDVRAKAEELYEVRSERMDLSKKEGELAAELLGLMKKHKLTEHREGDLVIKVVVESEKVKVKKVGGEGDDEE